jgi:hypothetical protein
MTGSGSGYLEYNLNKTVGLVADFGGYARRRTPPLPQLAAVWTIT